jgi:hypothetical protein
MTTTTIDRPMISGPVPVELGSRVVTDKRELYPYPRQSFPIDRPLLEANGYGDAAISGLESGSWIVGGGRGLGLDLADGEAVLEFPDGARYARKLEYLGGETLRVTILRRLPNAIR